MYILPKVIPIFKGQSVIEGPIHDQDVFNSIAHLHPLGHIWAVALSENQMVDTVHWDLDSLCPSPLEKTVSDLYMQSMASNNYIIKVRSQDQNKVLDEKMDQCLATLVTNNSNIFYSPNQPNPNTTSNTSNTGPQQFNMLKYQQVLENNNDKKEKQSQSYKMKEKLKQWIRCLFATKDPKTKLLIPTTLFSKFPRNTR